MLEKTIVVKELKGSVVLRVSVKTNRGTANKEIARFCKTGLGWVSLGAAARSLIKASMPDHISFDGTPETYRQLVALGVIEEK